MSTPKWLRDLDESINNVPFGEIVFRVKRHRNMTTAVEKITHSRLRYVNNERAFADIEQLMNNLIESGFTGKLQFEQTFVNGTIVAVTIKNKQDTNYRDKK